MQFGSFVLISSLESQIGRPAPGADFVGADVLNLASGMSQFDSYALMPIWLKLLHFSLLLTLSEIAWGKSDIAFHFGFFGFACSNHGFVDDTRSARHR